MNGTTTKTELTRDNVREVAQLRVDGTSWKKIGAMYGVAETTAKAAFTRAVHDLGLLEHPQVRKAIPADLPAAIVAAIAEEDAKAALVDALDKGEVTLTPSDEAVAAAAEAAEAETSEPAPAPQPERDDDHVVAIVSPEYAETVKKLLADQIIDDMAHGLLGTPQDQLTHPNGQPRHEFMMAALHEYNKRNGEVNTHIGGPAEALLVKLAELRKAEDVDVAEQVGQKIREDNAAAKADTETPATATAPVAGTWQAVEAAHAAQAAEGEFDHCIHCGWNFGHKIDRNHCGSARACARRQADPARDADKRRQLAAA